ncbi:MAG: winged helix-turn-helix domain-containing protein [Actinobacteria bacterium]|nr:winged helix-turn-helix domain-containing protein [Actinomycetota bacterium]MCG2818923.1 winged helix-turn-helix domain-containing protein [Actinomycetes bacterium]MBU4217431.1 winged helix-turn-helix domain-containing protein [Actinomycetota bacterium]MBU4357749.1 winged helix-turn-helix domain-containing protein [Actinomycetota bacterium]MBU4390980.1 winged helix-turn-helix domain-containing protein [Actinomycetota bacterium]
MGKLLKEFQETVREKALDIIWSQWAAVGVATDFASCTGYVVDPEALMCATATFGRYNPRIFDEAIDWMAENQKLVNVIRAKNVANNFREETRAVLGAVFDYLSTEMGLRKYTSRNGFWREHVPAEEKELFKVVGTGNREVPGGASEEFLRWMLVRGKVRTRGYSTGPDIYKPENLAFRLRWFFGVNARAEVIRFLMLNKDGNSSEVAKAVDQNQAQVHTVLNELVNSGLAKKYGKGREKLYSVERTTYQAFFGLSKPQKYLWWAGIFSALEKVLYDEEDNPEWYRSEYLMSSRFRDLTEAVSTIFRDGGLKTDVPDMNRYRGEEYRPAFMDYVIETLGELAGDTQKRRR